MSAAAAAPNAAPNTAPNASAGNGMSVVSFLPIRSVFDEEENFDLQWNDEAWMEWMNTAPCGNHHLEYEPCPDCLYLEAQESLWRAFERQLRDAYDASLPGPEGDDHSWRKLPGERARKDKLTKNRENADRHHAKLQWREKRRVAREDPSSAPIGVKADRNPKARHHKRANARLRYGPVNHQAQRQRDVDDERFALVDRNLAEEDDWFTPDDFADEEEDDKRYLPLFEAYVPFVEAPALW